jgi:hypothetical protein
MDWIEEKFIQHNKSSNLIKNVANALIEDLFISKDLFTLEQTSLYINNFISQLPVAIKNEVEKIRG